MSDIGAVPEEEEGEARDPEDPGEVHTGFATKGLGWSGRDEDEDDDPLARPRLLTSRSADALS